MSSPCDIWSLPFPPLLHSAGRGGLLDLTLGMVSCPRGVREQLYRATVRAFKLLYSKIMQTEIILSRGLAQGKGGKGAGGRTAQSAPLPSSTPTGPPISAPEMQAQLSQDLHLQGQELIQQL